MEEYVLLAFAIIFVSISCLFWLSSFLLVRSRSKFLFKQGAVFRAPGYFRPRACPHDGRADCKIWNCYYYELRRKAGFDALCPSKEVNNDCC